MEGLLVELVAEAAERDAIDVPGMEAGVVDRLLGGLRPDLDGGAPGRLRVLGLTNADDGDRAADRFEVA